MSHRRISAALRSLVTSGAMLLLAAASALAGQDVPIVQPGAPGQKATTLTAQQAVKLADARYTADDVTFMRDMIHHHDQAVQMAAVVKERTNLPELVAVAGRINASQADEIAFMQTWLRERGESVPDASMHRGMDMKGTMVGMASPADTARLATLKGADFDRLFLTLMIAHHDGALKMVDALVKMPGSAYDPVLFQFTSDVKSEQKAEIERMSALLGTLATDPRVALKAGFKDAGQAASHLALVATLDKPTGFFDPANVADLPPPKSKTKTVGAPPAAASSQAHDSPEFSDRSPLLSFAHTDMAFRGDVLVTGNYHGFNIYRLTGAKAPTLLSSVVCPGGQGDVSIVGNLLIMSVEQTRGRVDCGRQGVDEDVSTERFRGLRIFDISDPTQPAAGRPGADLPRLAHPFGGRSRTRTASSSTTPARPACARKKSWPAASAESPGDTRTALFRIDVIEIPQGRSVEGAHRRQPRRLRGRSDRAPSPDCGGAATTATARRKRAKPTSATTSRCSPLASSRPAPARATASCSTSRTR